MPEIEMSGAASEADSVSPQGEVRPVEDAAAEGAGADAGERGGAEAPGSGKVGFQATGSLTPGEMSGAELPATLLGRYQVLEIVGRGAFSVVYRANQVGVGRIVALKVFRLHKSMRRDPRSAEAALLRFQREARLASSLRHPNTITLYDYDKTDANVLYMAFEFVDGPTLAEEIKEHPQGMGAGRVIHIARQIALSLEEAHEKGIIHRDMKPGNIMLTRDRKDPDFTKVLDFGIAKLVEDSDSDPDYIPDRTDELRLVDLTGLGQRQVADVTGEGKIVGTPRYVPPEQIRGGEVTPAADIYSLGLIMHEMLSGVPANPGKTPQEMVEWHLEDRPFLAPRGYQPPAGLAAVIRRATRREPSERYPDCTALVAALAQLDADGEVIKEPAKRPWVPVLLAVNAAILLIVLLALGIWLALGGSGEPAQPAPPGEVDAGVDGVEGALGDDVGGAEDEAQVAEEVDAAPTPAVVGPVELEVSSSPDKARVFVGRDAVGMTPFVYKLGADQDEVTLRLRKFGYDDVEVVWRRSGPPLELPIVLPRRAGGNGKPGGEGGEGGGPGPAGGGDDKGKDKDNKYFILQ